MATLTSSRVNERTGNNKKKTSGLRPAVESQLRFNREVEEKVSEVKVAICEIRLFINFTTTNVLYIDIKS